MSIQWFRSGECAVALDTRYDPIFISTWVGTATEDLVDRYFAWTDAAAAATMAAEQQLVIISDLSQCSTAPGSVRKRAFEHARSSAIDEVVLTTIVVLDNPVLRGVVNGMKWMNRGGRKRDLVLVEDVGEAIDLALARLNEARIPPPLGLSAELYESAASGSE